MGSGSVVVGPGIRALAFRIPKPLIGFIMAFGAGVLISAVAFDLVEEAVDSTNHDWVAFVGISTGCVVYALANWRVNQLGGSRRKDASHVHQEDDALGIVLGSVLDGIPESLVIGLTIVEGGAVGTAYLAAVFISNLPEAISSTAGLVASGWRKSRILWMWVAIALVSGLSSLLGYSLFQDASANTVAFVLCFAAGGILAMLAETMMPEAFQHGGKLVGIATTLGFVIAFGIHQLD